jgi:hypothetical protein
LSTGTGGRTTGDRLTIAGITGSMEVVVAGCGRGELSGERATGAGAGSIRAVVMGVGACGVSGAIGEVDGTGVGVDAETIDCGVSGRGA